MDAVELVGFEMFETLGRVEKALRFDERDDPFGEGPELFEVLGAAKGIDSSCMGVGPVELINDGGAIVQKDLCASTMRALPRVRMVIASRPNRIFDGADGPPELDRLGISNALAAVAVDVMPSTFSESYGEDIHD